MVGVVDAGLSILKLLPPHTAADQDDGQDDGSDDDDVDKSVTWIYRLWTVRAIAGYAAEDVDATCANPITVEDGETKAWQPGMTSWWAQNFGWLGHKLVHAQLATPLALTSAWLRLICVATGDTHVDHAGHADHTTCLVNEERPKVRPKHSNSKGGKRSQTATHGARRVVSGVALLREVALSVPLGNHCQIEVGGAVRFQQRCDVGETGLWILGRKSLKNGQFSPLFWDATPRGNDGRSPFFPRGEEQRSSRVPE